jgi:soluble lytic murein transglycosylase
MMAAMSQWRSTLATLAVILSLLLTGCNAPIPAPTSTPTVTATSTPTLTPTPTPTPEPVVRLEAGDRALFCGDWTTAISEYQSAIDGAGDLTIQASALLGLGDALVRSGRIWEGIDTLTVYLDTYPDHERRAQAFFLRARARAAVGQYDLAIQDYDQYLGLRPGRLDSFVQEHVGDALRQLGRPAEAVGRYQSAMAAPRLGSALDLQVKIGQAHMEAGEYSAALAQFDLVFQSTGDPATKASMNYLAGLALEAMGDYQRAYARYLESVTNYPEAYDSYAGLIRLVDAGVPVDDFQRGLVDFNARAYEPALAAFNRALSAAPSGAAFYSRGLTRRALDDAAGALADFTQVVTYYPNDPHWADAYLEKATTEWAYLDMFSLAVRTYLDFVAAVPTSSAAADALFAAGRTAERMGELAMASEIWLRLPNEYPSGEPAYQGAFEAGIALYRLADYPGAHQAFVLADSIASDSSQRAAAQLWEGKALSASGDTVGAQTAWRAAAAADPTGYYAVRAEDLLASRQPFQSSGAIDFTVDTQAERQQAEAWLRATFATAGLDPLTELSPQLAGDPLFVRGMEFWSLGLYNEARAEFEALRRQVENDAEATYRLMHAFLEIGLYRSAISAARQILQLAGMDDTASLSAPVYFNRIRFGPYFADLILPEAAGYGLDGLLLLSLVRQESLFEGFAISSSGAHGLMQVMPATGQGIADALGWPPDYTEADLYRPLVSVRFGTYYLAAQRDRFDGDLYAALAAYNAGPGNAAIWHELAPDDPDLLLEVVRLQQPHLYIRRIYEVFDIYRRLYVRP